VSEASLVARTFIAAALIDGKPCGGSARSLHYGALRFSHSVDLSRACNAHAGKRFSASQDSFLRRKVTTSVTTRSRIGISETPERDEIRMNLHCALRCCLSMIFSENRYALFRIVL
jgi:hypothetical protein